jgi:hypothetical protein
VVQRRGAEEGRGPQASQRHELPRRQHAFLCQRQRVPNGRDVAVLSDRALESGGNYYYQSGSTLKNSGSDAILYPTGITMVGATGSVYNENGNLYFTPFAKDQSFSSREVVTSVDYGAADTIVATQLTTAGSYAAYVTYFGITYQPLPPQPTGISVSYAGNQTLRFTWQSGGGSTAGYRVKVASGVAAPADATGGVDTTNTWFDVTGLAPGGKVSIRVSARTSDGYLSPSPGIYATGTAGTLYQVPQTGYLVESSLSNRFAQVYDNVTTRNVIYTLDTDNNYIAAYKPNDTLGYINLANGDLMDFTIYEIQNTFFLIDNIDDGFAVGNLANIPDGARYLNGNLIRSGSTYYYENGAPLLSGGNWYYSNGNLLKDATQHYWSTGQVMRSAAGSSFFPTGAVLRSGNSMYYSNTGFFVNAANGNAYYPTAALLQSGPIYYYLNGVQMLNGAEIHYASANVMITQNGVLFLSGGGLATIPFEYGIPSGFGDLYVRLGTDRIANFGITAYRTDSNYLWGGAVDYPATVGDYSHDCVVDAAEYVTWRKTEGASTGNTRYGDGNSQVDAGDYNVWRAHFGQTFPAAAGASVEGGRGSNSALAEPLAPSGDAAVSAPSGDSVRQPPADPAAGYPAGVVVSAEVQADVTRTRQVASLTGAPFGTAGLGSSGTRTRHPHPGPLPVGEGDVRDDALVASVEARGGGHEEVAIDADVGVTDEDVHDAIDDAFDTLGVAFEALASGARR